MYTSNTLKKRGIKIFKGGQQILDQPSTEEYPQSSTKLQLGEHLISEDEYELTEISYAKLREFNIMINRILQNKPFTTKIETFYSLAYDASQADDNGAIPRDHRLIYDSFTRCVRLWGPRVKGGKTPWLSIDRPVEQPTRNKTPEYQLNKFSSSLSSRFPSGAVQKKTQFMTIPEVAIGISSHGELVCLPKYDDGVRIAVVGQTGFGKTFLLHRLQDQFIEKDYAIPFCMNDVKLETETYTKTWDDTKAKERKFIEKLKMIGEVSKPEPIVFLSLVSDRYDENRHLILPREYGFSMSLPYKELMKNIKAFSPFYKLEKSEKFLQNLVERGLLDCKNFGDIEAFIDRNTQKKKQDGDLPMSSAKAILSFLRSIDRINILDISNHEDSKFLIEMPDGTKQANYPWIITMIAGLPTVLCTQHIVKEDYDAVFMNFVIKTIFDERRSNPLLAGKTIVIFGDELSFLLRKRESYELIDEVIRIGRADGVGMVISVQYHKDIFPSIRTNLTHRVYFRMPGQDSELREQVFKNHPEMYRELSSLEKMECIVKGDLILYNPITGEKKHNKDEYPVKMRILPPNSQHMAPRSA